MHTLNIDKKKITTIPYKITLIVEKLVSGTGLLIHNPTKSVKCSLNSSVDIKTTKRGHSPLLLV